MTTEAKAAEVAEKVADEMAEEIADEMAEEIADELSEEIADESAPVIEGETIEAVSSDAVAIAAIEADKDIQIAEIEADVETARIEAEQERANSWQIELETLQVNMRELAATVETLQMQLANQSTPDPLTEVAAEVATEIAEVEANNSTPQFMSPPTSETQTEVILESEGGKPEAAATVTVRKKRRLI